VGGTGASHIPSRNGRSSLRARSFIAGENGTKSAEPIALCHVVRDLELKRFKRGLEEEGSWVNIIDDLDYVQYEKGVDMTMFHSLKRTNVRDEREMIGSKRVRGQG